METESSEYLEYLNTKYLPGRPLFLKFIYYPQIFNEFKPDKPVWDLGCGSGEFLSFCKRKNRIAKGIDSNTSFILTDTEINLFFDTFEKKACKNGLLVCIVPGEQGFKRDPTHKTYVHSNLLLSVLQNKRFKIIKQYNHPFSSGTINKFFYLNMQVFIIKKIK